MRHVRTPGCLNAYLIDSNRQVILTMAVCPAVLFLSLLFEYDDFLRAILLDDRSLDDCIRKHRQAKLDVTVVLDKQTIPSFPFATEIAGRFLQPNLPTGRY